MSLDCNTANGRRYINYQHLCLQSFCTEKNVSFVPTVDTSEADVDAVLWRKHIVGVAEVKTRNMTFTELSRFGSYLITYAKLTKLCSVAKALHCPGLLIVYLIPDNRTIWWKICDKTGDFLFNPKIERTETQATCNGGTAIRYNAYLPLSLIQC
jgi:hypothetical protein